MANGLLNGLVEYWEPNIALGSLKGMVAGIDFGADVDVTVVTDLQFPSGLACVNSVNSKSVSTVADPLLSDFGSTDFLAMVWANLNAGKSFDLDIGEFATNGFDFGASFTGDGSIAGEIPGSDNSYPQVDSSPATPYIFGSAQCTLFWWTVADKTLHIQTAGGTEYTGVSLVGSGPPDLTNAAAFFFALGGQRFSDTAVWRGTIPDATQRALLFAGTPFSQFDNGGGGGPGTENCRASAIMVSLPWRGMLPQPDGTIGLGDRIQTAFMYRCIADPPPSGRNNDVFFIACHPHFGGHSSVQSIG